MAPDETSTISAGWVAIASTSASTRAASRPPVVVVSDDEPTFTTIRRAATTSSRTSPIVTRTLARLRLGSHIVACCGGLHRGRAVARRADPAGEGDVVRGDRRVPRPGRPAPGRLGDVAPRRGRPLAPGGRGQRPGRPRARARGAAPAEGRGHAAAG